MVNNNTMSQWLRHPSTWTQSSWQSSPWTPSPWLQNTTNSSTMDYYGHLCGDIEATTEKIIYSIFMIILLLCSLLGNTVVVSAVLLSNKLTQRSTFYFVASLAVSDMVMAAFQIPFRVSLALHNMNWCLNLQVCYIRILFDAFGNMGSILNLFLVSTDRFIAVQLPFRYDILLSKGKARIIIASTWIIAGIWSLMGIVQWNAVPDNQSQLAIKVGVPDWKFKFQCIAVNDNYQLASFAIFSIILVIMCGQYVRILQVVLRQIRDIAKNTPQNRSSSDKQKRLTKRSKKPSPSPSSPLNQTPSPQRDRGSSQTPEDFNRKRDSRGSRGSTEGLVHRIRFSTDSSKKRWSTFALKIRDIQKEMKATKTIALVFLAFCLCWLPSAIITYIAYIDQRILAQMDPRTRSVIFFALVDIFPMVNTMINPIIYSFSNTQFRSAVSDIWRKLHGKAPKRGSIFTSGASQGTRLSYCPTSTASRHSAGENLLSPPR